VRQFEGGASLGSRYSGGEWPKICSLFFEGVHATVERNRDSRDLRREGGG